MCICVCVFVALITQHAKRINPSILSSVACPVPPYFYILSKKDTVFEKKVTNRGVFSFSVCVLP